MKTLLLIRHAKSDWSTPSLGDFDRPLNERGKRDAPEMAQRLLDQKMKIDAFVSSSAKRAKKTATIFAKAYKRDKDEIIFREELYLATVDLFFDIIKKTPDDYKSIAVFSHNPGITDFANHLTDARIDNIPTCGIFAVSIDTKHWAEFENAPRKFLFADYPKAGQD
jgi:phosphohistidine phosphatase